MTRGQPPIDSPDTLPGWVFPWPRFEVDWSRSETALIARDWHRIERYALTPEGECPKCHAAIPGRFEEFRSSRQFGRRRIPVAIARR